MKIERAPIAIAILLTLFNGNAQQAPQTKKDSSAKKDATAKPATSSVRELYYLAVGPKDKVPPIRPVSGPPAKNPTPAPSPSSNSASPEAAVHLGIRYNLLLVDQATNSSTPVDPDRVFRNGDCLALKIEPNRSGYLYVLDRQSSGQWHSMLPAVEMPDERNLIDPGSAIRVPANYCFEIQDPPGAEHFALVFSRDPQNVLDLYEGIREEKTHPSAPSVQMAVVQIEKELGTRDIAIQKVSQPASSGETAESVYVVHPSNTPSSIIFYEFDIKHR